MKSYFCAAMPILAAMSFVQDAVAQHYPAPQTPYDNLAEQASDPVYTLDDAIDRAYRTNPQLQAKRYDQRGIDEGLAQARAELRTTAELQLTGDYGRTDYGEASLATRSPFDPGVVTEERAGAQLIVTQPLSNGGRTSAAIIAASEDIHAGRAALRASEGDVLTDVITAYVDVRRDTQILAIRNRNVEILRTTLAEVTARREAGELTRTDIAQAELQLASAEAQRNDADAVLEASRASFAAIVGRPPGQLIAEPPLPGLPGTVDAALDRARTNNPELSQAIFSERGSRARVAAAQAERNPTLSLRGTASLTGPAAPYLLYEQDKAYSARLTLTVPLAQGGRVGSLIAQARDRNAADRFRIENAWRQLVRNVSAAWNQMATNERNIRVQQQQLVAARVYYEGMFEEYRAGLRSTFDVLFAQNALRDNEIATVALRRDLYVAQTALLRQIGSLEIGRIMTGTAVYDPIVPASRTIHRAEMPWDRGVRGLDRLQMPAIRRAPVEAVNPALDKPKMALPKALAPSSERPLIRNELSAPHSPGQSSGMRREEEEAL